MAKQTEKPVEGSMSLETKATIERLLTLKQMTHGELAENAGIHPGELSKMLNRRRPVGVEHLRGIARLLGVRPGELLDAGQPNPEIRRRDQLDAWIETSGAMFLETLRNQVRYVVARELEGYAFEVLTRSEEAGAQQQQAAQ